MVFFNTFRVRESVARAGQHKHMRSPFLTTCNSLKVFSAAHVFKRQHISCWQMLSAHDRIVPEGPGWRILTWSFNAGRWLQDFYSHHLVPRMVYISISIFILSCVTSHRWGSNLAMEDPRDDCNFLYLCISWEKFNHYARWLDMRFFVGRWAKNLASEKGYTADCGQLCRVRTLTWMLFLGWLFTLNKFITTF